MIRTIIFDLGGVIVPFDFRRGYQQLESLCPYAAADIPKRISATDLVPRFEKGQIDRHGFYQELSTLLELRVSFAEFRRLWNAIFLPESPIPLAWLTHLRTQHRMLVLSNTNEIHYEVIQAMYPHLRHFDGYVLSYEVGAMKPEAPIYQRAIELAGCAPEECFFVDDVEPYVLGARQAGIDAVRYTGVDDLRLALFHRGIPLPD
jgi:putative hydrolase of the HAD superfamily